MQERSDYYPQGEITNRVKTGGGLIQSLIVSVTKTLSSSGPYSSSGTVTYTINVANAGPDDATDVVEVLPKNLEVTSSIGPNSSCTIAPATGVTTSVDCTILSLAIGTSETITVQATTP